MICIFLMLMFTCCIKTQEMLFNENKMSLAKSHFIDLLLCDVMWLRNTRWQQITRSDRHVIAWTCSSINNKSKRTNLLDMSGIIIIRNDMSTIYQISRLWLKCMLGKAYLHMLQTWSWHRVDMKASAARVHSMCLLITSTFPQMKLFK